MRPIRTKRLKLSAKATLVLFAGFSILAVVYHVILHASIGDLHQTFEGGTESSVPSHVVYSEVCGSHPLIQNVFFWYF